MDEADYEWASSYCWHLKRDGYAYRNLSHRTEGHGSIALHRQLMDLAHGDRRQVDHRNRRKLDCRRCNLRVVAEDGHNKQNIPPKGASRHRGVSFHKASGKWRARCQVGGRSHALGYFATEEKAAEAAATARREAMPFSTD